MFGRRKIFTTLIEKVDTLIVSSGIIWPCLVGSSTYKKVEIPHHVLLLSVIDYLIEQKMETTS